MVDLTKADNYSGINPWWTFEEGSIPGAGEWRVNHGTGNLVLQDDDFDIHGAGIDLALRRTYNSTLSSDTSNLFGNGWTSTFTAHLSTNSGNSYGDGISVYDIDGARYDYLPDGSGNWLAPYGQHASLAYDGGEGYYWYKPNGTIYHFFSPDLATSIPSLAAVAGWLGGINARDQLNSINFYYNFANNDVSGASALNTIQVVHSNASGGNGSQYVTLNVTQQSSRNLITSAQTPDGLTFIYTYDSSGRLLGVGKPWEASAGGGYANSSVLYSYATDAVEVFSPRAVNGLYNGGITDGAYDRFSFAGVAVPPLGNPLPLIQVSEYANVNPSYGSGVYSDGSYTSGALQSGFPSGLSYPDNGQGGSNSRPFRSTAFTYGNSPSYYVQLTDTDGRNRYQYFDQVGRPTQRSVYTGSTWLQTEYGWDGQNNMVYSTDERSNVTNYEHDANGDETVIAKPAVAVANVTETGSVITTTGTGSSTIRPTQLYSYDNNFNLIAACSARWSQAHGKDWDETGDPGSSSSLCPNASDATTMAFQTPPTANGIQYESYGRLVSLTTPGTAAATTGYTKNFQYNAASEGGTDHGLPTSVAGAYGFSQIDGTTRLPQEAYVYDTNGNVIDYSNGVGTWTMTYDSMNRRLTVVDPDGVTIENNRYNVDGTVAMDQNTAEHNNNIWSQYGYDLDDDKITETKHFGGTTESTSTIYDGADRTIEVVQPCDRRDEPTPLPVATPTGTYFDPDVSGFTGGPYDRNCWLTRNLYDLSQGGTNSDVLGHTFRSVGAIYKIQKYDGTRGWRDYESDAYDFVDRLTTQYEHYAVLSSQPVSASKSNLYDNATGGAGLLISETDGLGNSKSYTYDAAGRKLSDAYNTSEPGVNYSYDADGNQTNLASSALGSSNRTYDAL